VNSGSKSLILKEDIESIRLKINDDGHISSKKLASLQIAADDEGFFTLGGGDPASKYDYLIYAEDIDELV